MPRTVTVIQVFVSSPSDVQAERSILEALLQELNHIWSKTLGITFELLQWEKDTYPAWGSDPQAVINQQLGDEYDIFIGILWGRFGTPTPRASSGTKEEFEKALERFRSSTDKPEIMIYFKDAPIAPSKMDPEQLAQVHNFKSSIGKLGGLYGVFEDDLGFQNSLRAHLSSVAQKFASKSDLSTLPNKTDDHSSPSNESLQDDDRGYLELLEIYEEKVTDMTHALDSIGKATAQVGEKMKQRTEEIESVRAALPDLALTRKHVRRASNDMESYAKTMQLQIPILSLAREEALGSLTKALSLYEDFSADEGDLDDLHQGLTGLRDLLSDCNVSTAGFRTSIYELPRLTTDLNKAKRSVLKQLDALILELENTDHTLLNILVSIERMRVDNCKR